ncbi:MAG: 4-(cytidine 5'-diphospho)-2-C-methyl-D-erythritol kinase, partial [Oscillospiraceae bacterium]|nr:4-(cytidine 5'-diphospho)-2-C-methyl-D-erythritol kinase [Oscillospiraceae bacterium]
SWDPNGLKILLHKSIPSEAGLGGGSSDGAAVLRALNRCVPNPLSPMELADLGAKVGSDVPFCVLGGTAFCEGRGERLTPLSVAPKFSYVLCKPDLAFSTPKLFAKLDSAKITKRPDHSAMVSALQMGDADTAGRLLCNVFEEAVLDEYPVIQEIKTLLIEQGACGASMTGSGSVVYGIFPSEEAAIAAVDAIKNRYCNTFFCKTV